MKEHLKTGIVITAALFALTYVGLRTSRILVHRWCEVIKPGGKEDRHGSDYWIRHDVGHGTFLNPATLIPRSDRCDSLLRCLFLPCVEAEGMFWTMRERINSGGGVWFYTSAQRQELRKVLIGKYGHNVRDGIYTYGGSEYSYTGTAWKKLGPTSRLQATPGSRLN